MTRARDLAAFVSNADGDIKFDTDTLFIDSSANRVSIGNTAPSRPLHITANPAMIMLEDSDGGSNDKKAQIQVDSGAFEVNSRNDDDSSRKDNILVADLETGDIGIGTNTPLQRLTIFDDNSDINMSNGPAGQFGIDGNGYGFAIALNSSGAQMYTNSSVRDLIFGVNETEVARVTPDGLTFNGDTAAANALDDYEQGYYDVTANISGSGTVTFASGGNSAFYTKIGNLVTVGARLDVGSVSSPSGHIYLSLPFAPNFTTDSAGLNIAAANIYNPSSDLSGHLVAEVTSSYSGSIILRQNGGKASGVTVLASHIDSGSLISFTLSYHVA